MLTGPDILSAENSVAQTSRRAKAVILIYLPGGLAQHETFDLKPDAPDGIRGEFSPIATDTPGIEIGQHLPLLARRTRHCALVRSMSHQENNHFPATHKALTGHVMPRQRPGDAENFATRGDWPCYAAAYDALSPRGDGIPNGVSLPHRLIGGTFLWPGQHGGFVGSKHDPWQIEQDPNQPNFRDETLSLPAGISIDRLSRRQQLVAEFEQQRLRLLAATEEAAFGEQHALAVNLLTAGQVAAAFEIDREPAATRDRYGRHSFGQSLLLARRLVQAGVTIVQANMGAVQTWDTHESNFVGLRDKLLPPLDQGLSALLDDLTESGLLAETLVVMTGEFGRTPKISLVPGAEHVGRNHWPQSYTALFAGAGVQGGQTIGRSDSIGAYPTTRSFSPDDLGTTLFAALGLSADAELHDQLGRPIALASGQIIDIYVLWKDEMGAKHQVRAQEWVKDAKKDKAMSQDWVFAGSGFWKDEETGMEHYKANGGDLVCVSNFPTATLDLPIHSTNANDELMFVAYKDHVPPRGTKVRLVFIPRAEKQ